MNERYGFIGVSWKWRSAYLTGVGSGNRIDVENCLIFSLLDLLNYLENEKNKNNPKNLRKFVSKNKS